MSKLPLRVQRFKLRLMRYDYVIFHTPGCKMFLADSLSRPCERKAPAVNSVSEVAIEPGLEMILCDDIRENELVMATSRDATTLQCIDFLTDGWPPSGTHLRGEIASLYHNRKFLSIYRGLVVFRSKFYGQFNPLAFKEFRLG